MTEGTSPDHRTIRFAGLLALIAGLGWLLLWGHQLLAHGSTAENERRLVLGLTWMDSGKVFVVVFLLLLVVMIRLHRARRRPSRLGRISFVIVFIALLMVTVGTAFQFWPFPVGSYGRTFEGATGALAAAGVLQPLGTLVWTLASVPFGIGLVRSDVIPGWFVPVLVIGVATTLFLTPALIIPGAVWLLLGLILVVRGRRGTQRTEGGTNLAH